MKQAQTTQKLALPSPGGMAAARVVAPCAATLLAVLVYLPTLWYGFAFDDWWYIVDNTQVHEASGFWRGFAEPFPPNRADLAQYRPLLAASFTANYLMAEPTGERKAGVGSKIVEAWPFLLTNILLHAGATLFVFLIAAALTDNGSAHKNRWPFIPCGAAALFALHPVHIEAVANPTGRGEVQMALFYLAAIYFLLLTFLNNRLKIKFGLTAVIILFLLSIFTKESAITFPLFCAGCVLWLWRNKRARGTSRITKESSARLLLWLIPATLFYLVCRLWATQGLGLEESQHHFTKFPEIAQWPAMAHVPLLYLELFIFPVRLVADYQFPLTLFGGTLTLNAPTDWTSIAVIGCLIFLGAIAALIVGVWRGKPWGGALLLLLVPLAVYSNFIPFGHWAAERFLYLSSAGACLLFALALAAIKDEKIRWGVLSVILIFYAVRAIAGLSTWRSQDDFFSHQITVSPENPNSYYGMAQELFQQANIQKERYMKLRRQGRPFAIEAEAARLEALRLANSALDHHLNVLELEPDRGASRRALLDLAFFVDPPRPELVPEQYDWFRREGIRLGEHGPRYWLVMADYERNRGDLRLAFRLATAAMEGYSPQQYQIRPIAEKLRTYIIQAAQQRQQQQ